MKTRKVHVKEGRRGWTVRQIGEPRSAKFDTMAEAVAAGRKAAIQSGSELVIHRHDGIMRSNDAYGADPYPRIK